MHSLLLAAFLAGATSAAHAAGIDGRRVLEDAKELSSDAYEGRGPVSAGEDKTVAFLIGRMKAAGLKPGGDLMTSGERAWTQAVPLGRFTTEGAVAVSVTSAGKTEAWTQGEQIAIRAAQTGQDRVTIKDAPLVFVGYGVKAPERGWDDFKGVDLKGKVALVLINDPDFEGGEGDFGGKAMTYYGRWTYKFEEAARQGAIGFLVIHETAPASYGWPTVKNSNTAEIMDVVRPDPRAVHAPLEGWIQRDATQAMMRSAGLDLDELKASARTRAFRPVTLSGVTFSADYGVKAQQVVSRNVVGVIEGAKRPQERVLYTSHWDHLGVGPPDANGDRIYNGARDNASGVALLVELGRAFAKGKRPDRSVVFMAVTAEEKGLLGSEYYVRTPLYPLETTVGVLNMDGVGVGWRSRDFSTSGNAALTLQDDLIAVGAKAGRSYTPDVRPEAGLFFRSDHFPFAKAGVPAISFSGGSDLIDGGRAAGMAKLTDYNTRAYHQPADEFDTTWDPRVAEADGGLLLELGRKLANSAAWPAWKPGSEFKAVRDASAAARR
jgi:Zn-dependent M28 family amino/carboxypeptidase